MANGEKKGASPIESAFRELENRADRHRRGYRTWRKRYEAIHWLLGIPATFLGGAAAVSALQNAAPILVAVIAALSGALSAVQLFVRPAERAQFNHRQQIDFEKLAGAVEKVRRKLPSLAEQEAERELDGLRAQMYELQRRGVRAGSFSAQ